MTTKPPKSYLYDAEAKCLERERNTVGSEAQTLDKVADAGGRKKDHWSSKSIQKIEKPPEEDESGMPRLTPAEAQELEGLVDSCKGLMSRKDWVLVTENCSRQLEIVPFSLRAGKFMSHAQLELGKVAVASKKWDQADLLLNASLTWKLRNLHSKQHPDIASVYTELALVEEAKGHGIKAREFARQAIEIYDTQPIAGAKPSTKPAASSSAVPDESDGQKARKRLQFLLDDTSEHK